MANTFPLLVTFAEKHGDRNYLAQNEREREGIYAQILRERFREGCWYPEPETPQLTVNQEDADLLAMSDADAALLPQSFQEKRASVAWKAAVRQAEYERELEDYKLLEKVATAPTLEDAVAIRTPRGSSAAIILMLSRDDYEYEGVYENAVSGPDWSK